MLELSPPFGNAMMAVCAFFVLPPLVLFLLSGGIRLCGYLVGTPAVNVLLLALGAAVAAWTNGFIALALFLKPILHANSHRSFTAHTLIFSIALLFLFSGCLAPLPEPPPFMGFLKDVDFGISQTDIIIRRLLELCAALALYYALDRFFFRKEGRPGAACETGKPTKMLGFKDVKSRALALAAVLVLCAYCALLNK